MAWRRLGHVYAPRGERDFLVSHASVPFAERLDGTQVRIWFSPRDADNRSHIAWLVLDLARPQQILDMAASASLGTGPLGAFDDCGAMMSWLTEHGGRRLYYIGWNTRGTVPFHVSIGMAEQASDGTWVRRPGPLLDRSLDDPWFCSNPCVLIESGAWRMWYLSGLGWEDVDGRASPSYQICEARSDDGLQWTARGRIAVPLEGDEFAIARPAVLATPAGYLMWFSVRTRHRPYRLGAARSEDGRVWTRAAELAELSPAAQGWDSEMIAYPHVFEHAGERWMLYCGNGFGRTGFGLAIWE
ncbi:MAG TPA: hypothetical protein VKP66_09120 [Steroidobacteraceae bacterium]|nr:hypothetical protein [Steroidobacteraceae bacterium]